MFLPPRLWKIIRSRRTKISLVCLPFGLMIGGASSYGYANWKGERDVERHLARLKSLGYATSLEEYDQPAENPEDDVMRHPAMVDEMKRPETMRLDRLSAPHLRSRFPGLVEHPKLPSRHFAQREDARLYFYPPKTSEEATTAREIIDELTLEQERFRGIQKALERQEVVWIKTQSPGEIGGLFHFLNTAKFARQSAYLHLAANDPETAADILGTNVRLSRHLLISKPTVLSITIASATLQVTHGVLCEGILRSQWSEKILSSFENQLRLLDTEIRTAPVLRGELAFHAEFFRDPETRPPLQSFNLVDGWELDHEHILKRIRGVWWSIRPRGLRYSESIQSASHLLEFSALQEKQEAGCFTVEQNRDFKRHQGNLPVALFDGGDDVLSDRNYCWKILIMASDKTLSIKTDSVLAQTGIALERYRLKHGEHPENLAALVPEFLPAVLLDPYDGRPLRYRRQADGSPWVWSVGPDGKDEGGLPHKNRYEGDLIWITRPIPGFSDADFRR